MDLAKDKEVRIIMRLKFSELCIFKEITILMGTFYIILGGELFSINSNSYYIELIS